MTSDTSSPEGRSRRSATPRWLFAFVGGLVTMAVLVGAAWNVSLPYFAFSPGVVKEVDELISVEGEPPPQPESELYLLTVSVGTQPVNLFEYVSALLDPNVDLVARDLVRPPEVSVEEHRQHNRNLMDDSKSRAIFVAMDRLGYDVDFSGDGILVLGTVEDSPAEGVLRADDIIIEIQGQPVEIDTDGTTIIQTFPIGETIELTVLRGEERLVLPVTLVENTQAPGSPMVGFFPATANPGFMFPVDIEIDSTNIGGPSAGLVYTLGVMNALTPDSDLMRGRLIAGTGEIRPDGDVGPIGGVRQKVVAAEAAGAEIMLVPIENFEEALTIDHEIELGPVDTLDDALAFLEALPPS